MSSSYCTSRRPRYLKYLHSLQNISVNGELLLEGQGQHDRNLPLLLLLDPHLTLLCVLVAGISFVNLHPTPPAPAELPLVRDLD